MGDWEDWVDVVVTSLAPAVFISAIAFVWAKINHKKQKADLSDKRYKFYQRFKEYWLATQDRNNHEPTLEDLFPFAKEAAFLFGKDVQDHILSLSGKRHKGSSLFPDEDFTLPFRKYLDLP